MASRGHRDIFAADVEWRGSNTPGVSYARFQMDLDNPASPSIILSRFAPDTKIAAHTHDSNYFEYIIAGEQTVGKVKFGPGDVRIVKGGTGYGPITVGPQGCTVLIVFEDASRAMTHELPRRLADAARPGA